MSRLRALVERDINLKDVTDALEKHANSKGIFHKCYARMLIITFLLHSFSVASTGEKENSYKDLVEQYRRTQATSKTNLKSKSALSSDCAKSSCQYFLV